MQFRETLQDYYWAMAQDLVCMQSLIAFCTATPALGQIDSHVEMPPSHMESYVKLV